MSRLPDTIKAGNVRNSKCAARYDNPRGYVGLNGIELGRRPVDLRHEVNHATQKSAELHSTAHGRGLVHHLGLKRD